MTPFVKPEIKISKSVLNMIRTTQRNNMELKAIADNKANILISINALMITFLIPNVLTNIALIIQNYYYVPLVFLTATCLLTIVLSAMVLMPFSIFGKSVRNLTQKHDKSPFFFADFAIRV